MRETPSGPTILVGYSIGGTTYAVDKALSPGYYLARVRRRIIPRHGDTPRTVCKADRSPVQRLTD